MKLTTLIDRNSHCREWGALAGEIRDALVDALESYPTLDANGYISLLVEVAEQLLPINATNPDLLRYSIWLQQCGIRHAFLSLRGRKAHRLLVQFVPAMSQQPPAERITQQTGLKSPGVFLSTKRIKPMQATAKPVPAKKRSLWERLFPRRDEWNDDNTDATTTPGNGIETAPALENSSWLESSHRALTEATTNFIREFVEPLHRLNPSVMFSVRSVCVGMGEDASPCLEAWEKLPLQVRNGTAKILMEKAQGASEQLYLGQFYGLSFDLDVKLMEGQSVRTLLACDGRRVQLRFRFDGDYLERNTPVLMPQKKPEPSFSIERATIPLGLVPLDEESSIAVESPPCSAHTDIPRAKPPTEKPARTETAKAETPLVSTKPVQPINIQKFINKGETMLVSQRRKVIARLTIQPYSGDEKQTDIREGGLPYVIGREPGQSGYNIAPDEAPPGTGGACSRRHLVLESFDARSGQFHVQNHAHSRNGTYDTIGRSLPERFLWRNGEWLSLGGNEAGSVRIRLEAVS